MLETNNDVKISIIFDNFILFWIFRLTLFDYEYTLPKIRQIVNNKIIKTNQLLHEVGVFHKRDDDISRSGCGCSCTMLMGDISRMDANITLLFLDKFLLM